MLSEIGKDIIRCPIQVKFTYQRVQLSVFQISAVVLVVTEVNCRDPKRGPLVALSFIACGAKSQAGCVDELRPTQGH